MSAFRAETLQPLPASRTTRRTLCSLFVMSLLNVVRRSSLVTAVYCRYSSTAASAAKPKVEAGASKKAAGQPPVLAMADDQYPDWLWTILQPKEYPDDGPGGKLERVQRKKERQQALKDRNFMSTQ
ncbi:hypothetical protein BKA70DRAFT_1307098 [Coprinopsis sp. MPI-PUGE-AT-0042]|nr:hypothetical protein BKA70DRAFT_1307098 [Coprinopsis sp. MPI-PUGE-AT-0042]